MIYAAETTHSNRERKLVQPTSIHDELWLIDGTPIACAEILERIPAAGHIIRADKGYAGQAFEQYATTNSPAPGTAASSPTTTNPNPTRVRNRSSSVSSHVKIPDPDGNAIAFAEPPDVV